MNDKNSTFFTKVTDVLVNTVCLLLKIGNICWNGHLAFLDVINLVWHRISLRIGTTKAQSLVMIVHQTRSVTNAYCHDKHTKKNKMYEF